MQEKLEFLIALAREQHFGRAAQICGVSQPNLSLAVKQLESHFGVPLVDRGARFVGFTPEGQRVLEWARRIVSNTRAMHADIETMKQGLTGHLRFAVIPSALPVMSRLTTAFWRRHAGVKLSISTNTSTEILSRLENLEADAGITYLDNEPVGRVIEVPLYRERYHLVTSQDGAFADRQSVTWEEASTLPLALLSSDMQNRRIIDRIFTEVGIAVEPILETNSLSVLATHLRTGVWSSIMPRIVAESLDLTQNLRCIPVVAPEMSALIGMIVSVRDPQPPLAAALIDDIRQLAPELSGLA